MPLTTVEQELNDIAIMKDHTVEMYFNPSSWSHTDFSVRKWEIVNFPPSPRNTIPRVSGVYAFVVEPNVFDFNAGRGLFYIGKATVLYERISSYISEIGKGFMKTKRPHIWKMINRWDGHLKYYYTTTESVEEAEELENKMLTVFMPYFNRQFEAETSQKRRAW